MECRGDGLCFTQKTLNTYVQSKCPYKCKLFECNCCKKKMPKCYSELKTCEINKFHCNSCDFNKFTYGICVQPTNACDYCFRKLVPIGNSRQNGAQHQDWNNRKYHKKCWLKINLT